MFELLLPLLFNLSHALCTNANASAPCAADECVLEWSPPEDPAASDDTCAMSTGPTYAFNANASAGITATPYLPSGWYRMFTNYSQQWSYSPGRWFNAFGDPYKTNTGGCVLPSAHFSQLIFRAKPSSSSYVSVVWMKFVGNGTLFYHTGGSLFVACNDRPGQFGDNAGTMSISMVRQ